ncbi:ClpP/crotonase-like domain-containing protein [Hyaloraphidium curvatum]|nr:ClpP/crotonase-like domain-containing protein [Hyaloraphidium curvatum]
MATYNFEDFIVELDLPNAIGIVKLNRPDSANAWRNKTIREFSQCLNAFDNDDRIRCIVFGATGKIFSAGFDLKLEGFEQLKDTQNRTATEEKATPSVSSFIAGTRKPIVTAIQGAAVGMGITVPCLTDIRVAWEDAKIGFVFARRAIVPEAASSYVVPRLIGYSRTMELFLTGEIIPAKDERLSPMFNRLVKRPEDALPTAIEIAKMIAQNCHPISAAFVKGLVWHDAGSVVGQTKLEGMALQHLSALGEAGEAGRAFVEKRPPVFKASVAKDMPSWFPWWNADGTPKNKL